MRIEQKKCRCGRTISICTEARSIAHEAPECAWYKGIIAENKPSVSARVEEKNVRGWMEQRAADLAKKRN